MVNWVYKSKKIDCIEDLPEDVMGFIYEVTFNDGKKYLGSKVLYHKRTLPPLKGKKRKRKKVVESDWLTYFGSFKSQELKNNIKSGKLYPVEREILKVCYHKKQLGYHETKLLFTKECIESDRYYNGNILGKYFSKDV